MCLQRNVEYGDLRNDGLWSEEAQLPFYLATDSADSSVIEPVKYERAVTVQLVTLDAALRDVSRIRFLKIEAEGAEPEVIAGAREVLSRTDYVAADLGPERGRMRASTLVPVVNTLTQCGFCLVEYNPERSVVLFSRAELATL